MEKKSRIILPVILVAFVLVGILLFQTWQVYRLISDLTKSSGRYELESVSGELEATIGDAEQLAMKLAISSYAFLDDRAELEAFILRHKREVVEQDKGCFNVYMAGSGWAIIPDFVDMPDDYVATERDWYKGARRYQPSPYVSAPYVDAMTGNICYTVAVMLGDRDTVLALDYTMDNIQSHIVRKFEGSSKYAVIVTGDGIIAGCTDESLIGRPLADVLPEYTSVFALVKSRGSFVTSRVKAGMHFENLFATASGFGWYLIVSENDWDLYRQAYAQLIIGVALALLLTGIILASFLISEHRQRAALRQFKESRQLLSSVAGQLMGPLNAILNEEDTGTGENRAYQLVMLRTAGRQILDTLENLKPAQPPEEQPRQRAGNAQVLRVNKRFRMRILLLIVLAVVISAASNLWLSMRLGSERIRGEVNNYEYTLSAWVSQQKSILDMFCSVISTNPKMLDDYEGTVAYLDRITRQYPDISASYMTSPDREPGVYMNNGWLPPEGWQVEERQWYIDTLSAESGWTVSTPYYDEQTGLYCVTFAERVYDNETGAFLGNFGIDFFMDKLIDIMGGSYSDTGYAFLADTDGVIINHPCGSYQMTERNATNVTELGYGQVKPDGESSIVIRDYDGALRIITAKRNPQSRFTVYEAASFTNIYASTIFFMVLVVAALLAVAVTVYRLLTALLHWQDKMNTQIQQAADTAIAAGKAKSRFLAQMSHEIRTPINAVLGMNEMILRKSEDKEILDYAANIQTAGRILLSLINSILDFSKIEEGKMEIVPVEYDTTSFIHNLVSSISERAREKGLALIVEVDKTLPCRLYGDDVRLSQVIMNLLTNAVKYTQEGSVRFSVSAAEKRDGVLALRVSVEDTGIGIREEDIPRLFESFERLDEVRNHNIEGTGLGMSIVTRLLEMMGSSLEVKSVYGQGSVFSFTVEQKVLDDTPIGDYTERLSISQSSAAELKITFSGASVLVVDDNEMNLKVADNLLRLFGIAPELASSGYEAVEKIRAGHYHLVFLDHMMPKMDGIETLKLLKRESLLPEDTAVIVLTANAVNGARSQYLAEGFDDYLSKPIDVSKLEEQLVRYLPRELQRMEAAGESAKEANAPEGPLSSLTALGYNTKAALGYAAGDERFYLDLLRSFSSEEPEKAAAIRDSLKTGELKDYQILVHALKSTSRMIGADALSERALEQENAAKAGDAAAVRAGCAPLLEAYDRAAVEIAGVLGEQTPPVEEAAPAEELDAGALRERLSEAAACVETFETERASDILKELSGRVCQGVALREALRDTLAALDDFDTEKAAKLLAELLKQ